MREAVPAPEVDDEEQVGSIVARSSGIVTHIEPLSGEALVAQGDTVLAGEVLISGAVTLDAPSTASWRTWAKYWCGPRDRSLPGRGTP